MDRLSDYTYTMESCNHCGQCKWILGPKMRGWKYAEICPIHQRWHYDAYSGQGLINIAEEVLKGELAYADGLIDHIYRCTTCGACDVNCKSIRDMEVLETILALRAKCVEDGQGPMPPHKEYARRVEEEHNIYGKPHDGRFDWVPGEDPSTKGAGLAYFAGCSGCYQHPEIARDIVSILSAAGLRFTLLGAEEYCCGAPLWRTGQIGAAEKQARHILDALNKLGIKTVVTGCAECYGSLQGVLPEGGASWLRGAPHQRSSARSAERGEVEDRQTSRCESDLPRPLSARKAFGGLCAMEREDRGLRPPRPSKRVEAGNERGL